VLDKPQKLFEADGLQARTAGIRNGKREVIAVQLGDVILVRPGEFPLMVK